MSVVSRRAPVLPHRSDQSIPAPSPILNPRILSSCVLCYVCKAVQKGGRGKRTLMPSVWSGRSVSNDNTYLTLDAGEPTYRHDCAFILQNRELLEMVVFICLWIGKDPYVSLIERTQ